MHKWMNVCMHVWLCMSSCCYGCRPVCLNVCVCGCRSVCELSVHTWLPCQSGIRPNNTSIQQSWIITVHMHACLVVGLSGCQYVLGGVHVCMPAANASLKPVWLSFCQHGYILVWPSMSEYACMHVCVSICMPVRACACVFMYACRSVCMSACMYACMVGCLSDWLADWWSYSVQISECRPVCLYVDLLDWMYVRLYAWLYVGKPASVSVCLSVSPIL